VNSPVPRWWSQRFAPEGSQTATGVLRQLGVTGLDLVSILVRESVQNSWDARLTDRSDPIRVTFSLDRIGNRAVTWRKHLVGDHGNGPNLGGLESLKSCLTSNDYVLTISDRGTTGLGGPLRGNEVPAPGEVPNFAQFIRNVGEPRDRELGGGTYGFGKSIHYAFSRCSTILVRTRCEPDKTHPHRLIGAALGEVFDDTDGGERYTGRHWWGIIANDDVPDPILGTDVARYSDYLQLPDDDLAPGTDIVVIAPRMDLGDDGERIEPIELGQRIAAAIVWNLWPKFGSATRRQAIEFTVRVDGVEIPLPTIDEFPILSDFSSCLDDVSEMGLEGLGVQTRKSPPYIVGRLALRRTRGDFPRRNQVGDHGYVLDHKPFPAPINYVCRMRSAELVVDYLKTAQHSLDGIGYVGVYRASEQADHHFAVAEPPTHDSWQLASLTGVDKGVITAHRTFIKTKVEAFLEGSEGTASKSVQGLGRLASKLGSIISTGIGTAPSTKPGRSGGKKTPRKTKTTQITVPAHVEIVDGSPVVRATVNVAAGTTDMVVVSADTEIRLAGGRKEAASKAPTGASFSRIVRWLRPDGSDIREGSRLHLLPGEGGEWFVEASVVPDASVDISVSQEDL